MEILTTIRSYLTKTLEPNRVWAIGNVCLVLASFLALLSRTIADPDLWGHLRFGLDILQSRAIPRTDPYSYLTEGQVWLNHEWLAEASFALGWLVGGVTGLIVLKIVIVLSAFTLLFKHLTPVHLPSIRAGILLLLSLFLLFPFVAPIRPHMFTILGFTLILLIIEKAESGSFRWLWVTSLLFALWVNLHGGFLAGLGIFGLWALLHLAIALHGWKPICLSILASLTATLINPYNSGLLLFLMREATVPRPEITDWQPLQIHSILGGFFLLLLLISVSGLIFSRRRRNPVLVTLFIVTAILPLIAIRHLQLFVPAVLILVGEHIGDAWERLVPASRRMPVRPGVLSFLPVLLAVLVMALSFKNLNHITLTSTHQRYPVDTTALLKQSDVYGNLAVDYNWGEYVIWHLGARVKVAMDGRRETVYPDAIYTEYLNFITGRGDWDAVLTGHDTDMALVNKSYAAYNLMLLKPDWEVVYEDSVSALFVPIYSPLKEQLRQASSNFTPRENDGFFP